MEAENIQKYLSTKMVGNCYIFMRSNKKQQKKLVSRLDFKHYFVREMF